MIRSTSRVAPNPTDVFHLNEGGVVSFDWILGSFLLRQVLATFAGSRLTEVAVLMAKLDSQSHVETGERGT